jgi:iron complex outermembrane receptor protein
MGPSFDGSYRSKFSSNPSRSLYTDVDAYSIANFRAGLRTERGWDVYGTGLVVGQPGDPRTYGLTVRVAF